MDAHRLIYILFYGVNVDLDTFYALWRAISRSNSRSRRTLIHAQRASACILCLISPRYFVLLFLVWKQYWKIVASTLFRLLRFSNGTDSTSFLVWALSICSLPKYLQVFLPFLLMTEIFHLSFLTSMALMTSPVCLSVTSSVVASACSRSKREGLPCKPPVMRSMSCLSANFPCHPHVPLQTTDGRYLRRCCM